MVLQLRAGQHHSSKKQPICEAVVQIKQEIIRLAATIVYLPHWSNEILRCLSIPYVIYNIPCIYILHLQSNIQGYAKISKCSFWNSSKYSLIGSMAQPFVFVVIWFSLSWMFLRVNLVIGLYNLLGLVVYYILTFSFFF